MPRVTRVLIVDDHEALRSTLAEFFEQHGFAVDATGERGRAESLLAGGSYGAAILDLSLTGSGGREGFELLEFARLVCPGTRAVLLTSHAGRREHAEALRRGAHAFLAKPVPLDRLLEVVGGKPAG